MAHIFLLSYYLDDGINTPEPISTWLRKTNLCSSYVILFIYYCSSSTFENLHKTVEVPYTQGKWSAFLGSDVVTLATDGEPLAVTAEVACITQSDEFFINGSQWQGILGLGYKAISQVILLIKYIM